MMQAGPELDALIAEKVMGETKPDLCDDCQGIYRYCTCSAPGPVYAHYSTDIGAAWEVREHLASEHGWYLTLWQDSGIDQGNWFARFDGDGLPPGGVAGFGSIHSDSGASTAPHAICLAALAALKPTGT